MTDDMDLPPPCLPLQLAGPPAPERSHRRINHVKPKVGAGGSHCDQVRAPLRCPAGTACTERVGGCFQFGLGGNGCGSCPFNMSFASFSARPRSYLTPSTTQQGLLAVPCVIGQLAQIFMGAAFAPHLARIVTRREKLAALAAAELPDPEAEARADAAAAAAEAGAACGKEAAGGSAQECEGGGGTAASGSGGGGSDVDSCKGKGEGDGSNAGPSETAGAESDAAAAPVSSHPMTRP